MKLLKRLFSLTVIVCFIALNASAHDWPNQSSMWVYDMQNVGMRGQYELSVGTDTVVEGYSVKNILFNRISTWETGPGGETYTAQSGFERFNSVFEVGDSLMYMDQLFSGDTAVRLLYDFGAETGDSWLLKVDNTSPCSDSTFVAVTSIGNTPVGGEQRRYIDVTTTIGSDVILEGIAVERLGSIDSQGFGFFPGYQSVDTCLIYDGDETSFSCYYDVEMGSFPDSGTLCSFVSVSEYQKRLINVTPNPATDFVQIDVLDSFDVTRMRVFSLSGEKLMDTAFKNRLELSGLTNGTYLLQIVYNNGSVEAVGLIVNRLKKQITRFPMAAQILRRGRAPAHIFVGSFAAIHL